jgi:hypothetical protein
MSVFARFGAGSVIGVQIKANVFLFCSTIKTQHKKKYVTEHLPRTSELGKKKKFNGEVEKNESLQNLPSKVRVLLCPQGSLP